MKEFLLKIWDEESLKFTITFGNDPEGDSYIAELRNKISAKNWAEDSTPESIRIATDHMTRWESEVERFVNRHLVECFYEAVKRELKVKVSYHAAKVADRGYEWYKDYD